MRHILFEKCLLETPPVALPPSPPSTTRRLLGINRALQLSGMPPPSAASQILMARYVAGHLSLAEIMPHLWQ
ncbi:hypothetical protein [Hymenobacter psychrophilus]|uniref:Antitoxin VbhA domain-containing protein n=1 Tax=Hymenobacter psychrophilus TaxID=651662 RepID=A0A1H3MVK2_9BACT|nr:hypothetical protein [Hymenobacter psychrophilus]SDY80616.1 hypothetical protein SAMN04488069_11424 [Hymenobacter psychrophilus]